MAFGDSDGYITTNGEATVIRRLIGEAQIPVVLDIGANHGEWLKIALAANATAEVIALEPSRHFAPVVEDARRVSWLCLAAGKECGWTTLYRWGQCDGLSAIKPHPHLNKPAGQEQALCVTLDWLVKAIPRPVTFCKIDVEGGEMDVLDGAAQAIATRRIDTLQIEYGGTWPTFGRRLKEAFEFATRLGLSMYKVVPTESGLQRMDWADDMETFAYSNWVLSARTNL